MKKKGKQKAKARRRNPRSYHVKKEDWPKGTEGLKVRRKPIIPTLFINLLQQSALELHLHLLSNTFHGCAVPPTAEKDDVDTYDKRFSDEEELDTSIQANFINYSSSINEARKLVAETSKKLSETQSTISNNLLSLSEDHKLLAFEFVAAAGLQRFAPDITNSAETMYNLVHERVALHSFRLIAGLGGYSFMGCNLSFLGSGALLSQMYRNFFFSHLRGMVKKEIKAPGRVVDDATKTNSGKRRNAVSSISRKLQSHNLTFVVAKHKAVPTLRKAGIPRSHQGSVQRSRVCLGRRKDH